MANQAVKQVGGAEKTSEMAAPSGSRGAIERAFAHAAKELGRMLPGADGAYQIPWFGVVGDVGCRKSELLEHCGISARAGSPNAFGLGEDAATHWWFFNEALVIDFAESYFGEPISQSGNQEAKGSFFARLKKSKDTSGAWRIALDSLRKSRHRRPIDGIILAVNIEHLKARTPEQTSQLARRAEAMAERLHEAQRRLGVHFPVYVVLTNCEKVLGFEAFGKAVPDPIRDQILGWSAPHEPDVAFQTEWVDEAISSLHEAMCASQLELLPHVRSQADRDALYLLPRELNALREPLRAYLEPIFKGTSYRRGLPLRGIYCSGRLPLDRQSDEDEDEDTDAKVEYGPPRFVRQVLAEKVFKEPGLAKLDESQQRVLNKKVRYARLSVIFALIVSGLLSWYGHYATSKKVAGFAPVLAILKNYQDSRAFGTPVKAQTDGRGVEVLDVLATLDIERFEVFTAPAFYFVAPLTADTNRAVAHLLGFGVGKNLRDRLRSRADRMLPPSLDARVPSEPGQPPKPPPPGDEDPTALTPLGSRMPLVHLAAVRQYVDEISELYVNVQRYEKHRTRDLGELYLYLTGTDIRDRLEGHAGLYRQALDSVEGWPTLVYDRYRERAQVRVYQYARRFYSECFEKHPLREVLPRLAEQIDSIDELKGRESQFERVKAIYDLIQEVKGLIADDQAVWLVPELLDGGPKYSELMEILDGDGFSGSGEPLPLGQRFKKETQQRFAELRDSVWSQSSDIGGFRLLVAKDDKVKLSDGLEQVEKALQEFLSQSYVIGDETRFLRGVQRDAGARGEWNTDLLAQVLTWNENLKAYLETQRPTIPASLDTALRVAARKEFRRRARQVLDFATPEVVPGAQEDGGSFTPQRKDELKARVRNLSGEWDSIMKIIAALDQVNRDLTETEDNRLFNELRDDSLQLLGQVDAILEQEKLYRIRSDPFSWWEGDQPPGVVAFGARDQNDLIARLGVQRSTISGLATDFARPLVDKMLQAGEPFVSDPDVDKWKKIIAVLTDYEKKVPGNSLEELERFIEEDLNKIQLASCSEQLEGKIDRYNRNDFFKEQKYLIGTGMVRRCNQILKTVTLQGYVDLQGFFTDRLAGRFPFAGPDVLAEVETGDVVEFYRRFERYSGAFTALVQPGSGNSLFGDSSEDVLRFIQQVEKSKALFSPLLASEDENPDVTLDASFTFRVNRDNEVNGNQIIQWWAQIADERVGHRDNKQSAQWRTNDPVSFCLRWANDASFLPAVNQRAEHARVNGRTVCYSFGGRWAMLRALVTHAATPADRGRRSFLRPHTLRFETETSLASSKGASVNMMATDTRVYVLVELMVPGGKAAVRLPELPRRAPELSAEFLKANGIIAEKSGTKGEW